MELENIPNSQESENLPSNHLEIVVQHSGESISTYEKNQNDKEGKLEKNGQILEITKQQLKDEDQNKCWNRFMGIGLMLFARLLLTISSFMNQELILSYDYSAFEQLFVRGYIFMLPSLGIVYFQKQSLIKLSKQQTEFLKIRNISFIILSFGFSFFLKYMEASILTLLYYMFPIFTPFMGKLILKNEVISKMDWIAILFALCGLFFILEPSFAFPDKAEESKRVAEVSQLVKYLLMGACVGCAVLYSYQLTLTRKYRASVNPFTVNVFYGFSAIMVAGILQFIIIGAKAKYTWSGVGYISLCHGINLMGNVCNYLSVKYERASVVALMIYAQIVFTFIGDVVIYSVTATWAKILGSVLILMAGLSVSLYKMFYPIAK